jgi:membrane protein required for colicin V production
MNALDIGVVAVVVLSGIFAFARGFVREALSIAAWAGAAAVAVYGFDDTYRVAVKFITTPFLAELAAGAGLFLMSLIALTILTGYLARFVRTSAASPIDRTLGLMFGAVRGAVLVSIAWLLLDIGLPASDRPGWINDARTRPYLAEGAQLLRRLLPAQWQLKGSAAADAAAEQAIDRAAEAQRAMRALENPSAPPPAAVAPPPAASPVAVPVPAPVSTPAPVQAPAPAQLQGPAPVQAPAPAPPQPPSYGADERHDLDRLIKNAQ